MKHTLPPVAVQKVPHIGTRVLSFAVALVLLPMLVLSAIPSLRKLDQPLG